MHYILTNDLDILRGI
uniref:Uncharacterized protein n=1 Tax=Anguilla anguilla TaxID=7936 RepID=A0A0E9PQH3_ANGAN